MVKVPEMVQGVVESPWRKLATTVGGGVMLALIGWGGTKVEATMSAVGNLQSQVAQDVREREQRSAAIQALLAQEAREREQRASTLSVRIDRLEQQNVADVRASELAATKQGEMASRLSRIEAMMEGMAGSMNLMQQDLRRQFGRVNRE